MVTIRLSAAIALVLAGCAVTVPGEDEERERVDTAGSVYEQRALPELQPDSPLPDYVRYAQLANPGLERAFYEWKAALERVPQEASPPGTGAIAFTHMLDGGESAWNRTTLALQTDPMANLPLPSKLETAGLRALEEARATGLRFDRARLELASKVTEGYVELALIDQELALQQDELFLLETLSDLAGARARSGGGSQLDWSRLRTDLELARSGAADQQTMRHHALAELNAALGRSHDVPIQATLPQPRALDHDDAQLLALAAERNPELAALAHEVQSRQHGLELARKQYLPEFALSAGITGSISQMIGGMLTLPFLRRDAIEAGIAQAEAELKAAQALRREVRNDLQARLALELYELRNLERRITLFEDDVLPRAEQLVELSRIAYEGGQGDLAELLETRRTILDLRRTVARLRAERESTLARLSALVGTDLHLGG